jgi:hypothetical protein
MITNQLIVRYIPILKYLFYRLIQKNNNDHGLLSTLKGAMLLLLTYSHSFSLLMSRLLKDYISANRTTIKPNCSYNLFCRLTLSVRFNLSSDTYTWSFLLTSVSLSISFERTKFLIRYNVPFSRDLHRFWIAFSGHKFLVLCF